MKILNLYAGIGGNRKLWNNEHEITAIERNPEIAEVYKANFQNDKVIVGDAMEYLKKHSIPIQLFKFCICSGESLLIKSGIFLSSNFVILKLLQNRCLPISVVG